MKAKSIALLVHEINNRGISSLDANWKGGETTISRKYLPYLVAGHRNGLLSGEVKWCDSFIQRFGRIKCAPFAWRTFYGYCNIQQRMTKGVTHVRFNPSEFILAS